MDELPEGFEEHAFNVTGFSVEKLRLFPDEDRTLNKMLRDYKAGLAQGKKGESIRMTLEKVSGKAIDEPEDK